MDGEIRERRHTNGYCTETSEGPVYHRKWNGISCPVKLMTEEKIIDGHVGYVVVKGSNGLPRPLWRAGELAFALPGGGEL